MQSVVVNFSDEWHQSDGCFAKGTAFLNQEQKSGEGLISCLKEVSKDGVSDFLKASNGFFCAVKVGEKDGWMAVDKIRSIPIFYGQKHGKLYVSDDPRWILKQVKNKKIDSIARKEFFLTGYVTGSDTLFSDVKQLQAGEVVYFEYCDSGVLTLKAERYFRYVHHDYFEENNSSLHKKFDSVLENVFKRLIDYAEGRTIVVPLSGGYDSRLIVLMLKKMGCDNIVAFSYGRPGNKEALVSREIATQLGIRWEFVPYSDERWYRWYRSSEMQSYFDYADGLSSLPHIQDWPAVLTLKKKKLIPGNSVFVPGHTGDKVSGGLSKASLRLYCGEEKTEAITSDIIRYHYSLFDYKPTLSDHFSPKSRILRTLGDINQYPDGSSAFESWDITERQPKFIVNSVRVYEFFGYDWWIPFWDTEFMNYWRRIAPNKRINQGLYISYVNDLAQKMGVSAGKRIVPPKNIVTIIKEVPGKAYGTLSKDAKRTARKILPGLYYKNIFAKHSLAMFGCFSKTKSLSLVRKGRSINSIFISCFYLRFVDSLNRIFLEDCREE